MLTIRAFEQGDEPAVLELWQQCGLIRPQNDPRRDILRKSRVRPDLFRVGLVDGAVVATVMIGYEGHRGWLNYVAVTPRFQRHGIGRKMIADAEKLLRAEGCPKINLQVRRANRAAMAFYAAIGFLEDEVVSMGKRLEHDDRQPNLSTEPTEAAQE